jgi:lipopolysaccharide export LptBFGC system permease protein LptF
MIELLFNAVWLTVVVSAFAFVPRRSSKALLGVAAILVLLFPIISVSDDLALNGNSLEEALAIIVAFLILFVGLVTFARVETRQLQPALVLLATPSDPRSPPRA